MVSRKTVLALGSGLLALAGLAPVAVYGQFCELYTEDFNDWYVKDSDTRVSAVSWCDAVDLATDVFCDTPVSLRMVDSSDDVLLWVHFGDQGCTQVRIDFNYAQWENLPGLADQSDAWLRFATSTSDTLSCVTPVDGPALPLNLTYASPPQCFPATHTVNVDPLQRAVYWRFDKGLHPAALHIDDVVVSLLGCECGSTPVPTISEWGLIVMALLLLTAGAIIYGRRSRPAAV